MSPIFEYRGENYPDAIRRGNAMRFIEPMAREFCRGRGLDIGGGKWPLPGAICIELAEGRDANNLPEGVWDYIFSSHCLEHLVNPIKALEYWRARLRPGGTLMVYLPHPDMVYWRPQHCRKHLHSWRPAQMAQVFKDLGFEHVIHSERDMAWSFAVVGFNPRG